MSAFIPLSRLLDELRYASRTLRRTPIYTATAIVTLALGIGANALLCCFANALFLRPLPFRDAHELVGISTAHRGASGDVVDFAPSALDLVAYATRARTLASVGGIDSRSYAITGGDRPESVRGATVTASLWQVLGREAEAGRVFDSEEDRPGSPVAVISHALQQRLFPGAPAAALGRSLVVDGQPRTILGVMPPGFQPRMNPGDVWMPMGVTQTTAVEATKMQVVARLKPGVTMEMARVDLGRIAAELALELPDSHRDWGVTVKGLREKIGDSARAVTLTLVAAVAFLLLLTGANVTNLALVRAAYREAEVSTRLALGASKGSIVRHQVLEALIVSVAGGVLGTIIAAGGLRLSLRLMTTDNPLISTVSMDGRVLAIVGLVSIAMGIVCSIVPGRRSLSAALGRALAGGGRRQPSSRKEARLRRALMIVQVGLAAILLLASSSALTTLRDLGRTDPGLRPEAVYVGPVTLPSARYPALAERSGFVDQVLSRLRATPGVARASMVTNRFVPGQSFQSMVTIDGLDNPEPLPTELRRIDPEYFATVGMPLLRGRSFATSDRDGGLPVAIVNEALARQYLRGRDPLNARIKRRIGPWLTVVGVVPDVYDSGVGVHVGPTLYLPFAQAAASSASFVVKSELGPAFVERALLDAVSSVDPGQPVETVAPLPRLIDESLGESRFKSMTLALLSALALLVACLGIYGVTAYAVARRTPEVAVRMALGASPARILGAFTLDAGRFVAMGAISGLTIAFVLGQALEHAAPEVASAGPGTYASTGLILIAVGLVATLIPTLRASRVAPASVLRGD